MTVPVTVTAFPASDDTNEASAAQAAAPISLGLALEGEPAFRPLQPRLDMETDMASCQTDTFCDLFAVGARYKRAVRLSTRNLRITLLLFTFLLAYHTVVFLRGPTLPAQARLSDGSQREAGRKACG